MKRTTLAPIFGLTIGLWLGFAAAPALADQPVVVELFTSQGCAACPPADVLLGELAERSDVIALALHVDYWDYIGWADTFAQPQFTERQHSYGHAAGSSVVYTPQMVIGGVDHVVGNRPMDVADAIMAHREAPDPVQVETAQGADGWQVRAVWTGADQPQQMVVQVVGFLPSQEVAIGRGENEGLTAVYHNIVHIWQVVAEWAGEAPFETQWTPEAADLSHVVIVQATDHGAILGAAYLD